MPPKQRRDGSPASAGSGKAGKGDAPEDAQRDSGRFAYDGLDRVMHEKARLGILASLAANDGGLLFNDLKALCTLTDGNLSRHLAVLSDAGLVEIWKGIAGPRPQTLYRLTTQGRQKFAAYLGELERVISDAQLEAKSRSTTTPGRPLRRGRDTGGFSPA